MLTYTFLQEYSWVVVSFLAATFAFLMFVYSAGTMVLMLGRDESQRTQIFNAIDTKWRFTLASLLLFFLFAFTAFPGFQDDDSNGAGAAFWVPYLLLIAVHAISCELLRHIKSVGWMRTTCRWTMTVCGWLLPFMMGFFGSGFFTGPYKPDIISVFTGLLYASAAHTAALLYLYCVINDLDIQDRIIRALIITGSLFVLIMFSFASILFSRDAIKYGEDGVFYAVPLGYVTNLIDMPLALCLAISSVSLTIISIVISIVNSIRHSFWFFTTGIITLVALIFSLAGLNNTSCFPNFTDPQRSLTIANSCASQSTLFLLFILSFLLPMAAWFLYKIWNRILRRKQSV